jgi:hypothetical protein
MHVDAGHLPQLAQLGVGERRLQRTTTADDDDLTHMAGRQRRDRVIGDVGDRQLTRVEQQHPRHVGRHVAVADHHRPLRLQVK